MLFKIQGGGDFLFINHYICNELSFVAQTTYGLA